MFYILLSISNYSISAGQIVTPDANLSNAKIDGPKDLLRKQSIEIKMSITPYADQIAYYFVMGDSYHILSYDAFESPDNISVQIFHKADSPNALYPITDQDEIFVHYDYFFTSINSASESTFEYKQSILQHSRMRTHQQWNKLDRIICGVLPVKYWNSLKYWRISFMILPLRLVSEKDNSSEKVKDRIRNSVSMIRKNDETDVFSIPEVSGRVEAFKAFKTWLEHYNNNKATMKVQVVAKEENRGDTSDNSKIDASDLVAVEEMLKKNIKCSNRMSGLRTVKNCFTGKDVISELTQNVNVSTSAEAVMVAQKLLSAAYFLPAKKANTKFSESKSALYTFPSKEKEEESQEAEESRKEEEPFLLQNSKIIKRKESKREKQDMLLTMSSNEEDRHEWLSVCHGKKFHPLRPFYLEFQWLVCGSVTVTDFISTCLRKASSFKMKIVNRFHKKF